MKYRTKPTIIEAFQMTKETRWNNEDWPSWLHEAWNKEITDEGAFWCEKDPPHETLSITTLKGLFSVQYNDFIIQNVQGELYPCKPHIFEQVYEPVK